jgi:hypothetical protein
VTAFRGVLAKTKHVKAKTIAALSFFIAFNLFPTCSS